MLHFFAKRLREIHEKDEQGQKGFTLIELLVVVIIIGILAAIAIPTFLNQRENAWEAQTKSDIRNSVTNAESFATSNNGVYTGMVLADVDTGNSSKNSALTLNVNAAGTGFCIAGQSDSSANVKFIYDKTADAITANAAAGNTCTAT